MKQLKKTILTLALLLTAATSAWAESKPIGLNVEYAVGDVITTNSTGDVYVWMGIHSGDQEWVIKIISSVTPTISELGIVESSGFITLDDEYGVYDMNGNLKAYSYKIHCQGEVTGTTLEKVYVASGSGTLTDPYVFAPGPAASGNAFPITWSATTPNTASIAAMPAGNVTVKVKYFAQAELATSTGETPATLAPTAIDGVPANTDDPIVTPGTVANIGTTDDKQGTLMYYVSQPTGNTVPDAPDYDDDGWSENVPTANGLQEGNAYVWYYIKGAEPANIADRTDDNTRSDSDIMPLGTIGFVTLEAEPTYTVSLNQTGLADGEPAKWKAKSETVTTEVNLGTNDLEGVKKGETVTVTYTGSRKVIGVKAEKKGPTVVDLSTLSENIYQVTEDVILTGTPASDFLIVSKNEYVVTLDNVNPEGSKNVYISGLGKPVYIKLKGTSRLIKIYSYEGPIVGNVSIDEAESGGTLILSSYGSPLASLSSVIINGGTVKARCTNTNGGNAIWTGLIVNGGAVYLEGGGSENAVSHTITAGSGVTLYGWNGSAWDSTNTSSKYVTTDNTSGDPTAWTW